MLIPDAPFLVDDAAPRRREVARLIEDGLLDPLLPGVAGPAGCGRDRAVRVTAVGLLLPPRVLQRATLAERAASWLWCGGPPPASVDVAVPPGRALPRSPVLAVHERRLPPQDVAGLAAGGVTLTLTTPTRTLVDLLRLLPETEALTAAEPLAAFPGVNAQAVATCLDRMPRARGVPRARRTAAGLEFGPVSRSACP